MSVTRYKGGRHWAVTDPAGQLVCLTLYKKGGQEVERRLTELETMDHEHIPLFIGYASLEAWLASMDTTEPVFALPLVEPGQEEGGLRTDRLLVVTAQIDRQGRVHYCRLYAASLTRCYGEPFDHDWPEREAAWQSLWTLVQEELQQRGCTLRRASVAHPRNLHFLEGCADFVEFDRTTQRYRRRAALHGEEGTTEAVSPRRK